MSHITVTNAKTTLSHLIARACAGEEMIITKQGKPVVEFISVTAGPRLPGRARGMVQIAADFDLTPTGFETTDRAETNVGRVTRGG